MRMPLPSKPCALPCLAVVALLFPTRHAIAQDESQDADVVAEPAAEADEPALDTGGVSGVDPVTGTRPHGPPASPAVEVQAAVPEPPAVAEAIEEPPEAPDPGAASVTFEPGGGVRMRSADGRFGLSIGTRVQLLSTIEAVDDEGAEHEITIRRARIALGGNAFGSDLRFKLQLALSPADLGIRDNLDPDRSRPRSSPLLDYYVEARHLRDLELRLGQFKVASNRQRVTSSGDLELVDRSILNSEFNLDRDVGVELRSRDLGGLDLLSYRLGVFSGRGRDARGFHGFDFLYTARIDVTPLGGFDGYTEVDVDHEAPHLAIGAGVAYVDSAARDRGTRGNAPEDGGTTDTRHLFVDALFMARGLSVLAEFALRGGDRSAGDLVDEMGAPLPVTAPRAGYAAHAQVGYLLSCIPLGIAGRYAAVRGTGDTSLGDGNELTFGAGWYPQGHALKLQADYSRLWDDAIDTGEHRARLQLQLTL